MRRIEVEPRPNSTRLIQSQGLPFATDSYWPDDCYYSFTSDEIALIEQAGHDVFDMCCEAAEYLVEHPDVMVNDMAIPAFALRQIKESWNREPAWASVVARFDVCFGGLDNPDPALRTPRFYEFNADTPFCLVETACIQWLWLEQTGHGNDQYNTIYESLVQAWTRNLDLVEKALGHRIRFVHFATARGDFDGEEATNTLMLASACREAGWPTRTMAVEQIALSAEDGRFYDQHGDHIDVIFKVYPYEMMVRERFGEACFRDMDNIGQRDAAGNYTGGTVWIEPPYKMLWSNKALFAILWKLFKDDPRSKFLIPTYLEHEAPASLNSFARKPIFSRYGQGIQLEQDGHILQKQDDNCYGKEGHVIQELALPPEYKDSQGRPRYTVLGLWFIDGEPAGLNVREAQSPITDDYAPFIPHSISDGPVGYTPRQIPDADEIEASLRLDRHAYIEDSARVLEYIEQVVYGCE
ncbi:hypothetical protein CDD82_6751 [Ophiocordyceps australis]|uniref:Glutathionylspermidine synthase pre-ATP-grasp-like domain-containing protein n=1 Tax=Ophiocordyceps australis TaxID=1399860 RepID=A0A2C5ZQV1_9HYPO|nr:hypothetical protein CDD82_6751 [Ophiocordyceps australis]